MNRRRKVRPETLPPAGPPAETSSRGKRPRWKRIGFRVLAAAAVPAVVLVVLELGLRLLGIGYPTTFLLTIRDRGQDVWVQNNQFGWRFFGAERSRSPNPLRIARPKPHGTIRIFVFGESAAKGDPDPRFGLPRMLEATLSLRHPGTRFEIVNTAVTAINSHAILPVARDCAAADGDLWVLYMGNNEVVGPFGAGTVFGSQTPPLPLIRAALSLKSTRTGQGVEALVNRLQSSPNDDPDWRGMEMFVDQQIRFDDVRMDAVYRHFDRNLRDLLRVGSRHGVGMVVSTVAVNLKDCAPFGSLQRSDLTAADLQQWTNAFHNGVVAQSAHQPEVAWQHYQQALEIDDHHAELHFRLGQCALAMNRAAEAHGHFTAARDWDTLRFRCDSRINEVARRVAQDQQFKPVRLADAERSFAERSPDGVPGGAFFYEHVHLTFEGNHLLARILAEPIEELLAEKMLITTKPDQAWPSVADCAARLGWTDFARLAAMRQISPRLVRPPFTGQFDHERQMELWQAEVNRLSAARQPEGIAHALRVGAAALAVAPDDADLWLQMAQLRGLSGDGAGAMVAQRRALEQRPADAEGWAQLGRLLARGRQFAEAVDAFAAATRLDPLSVMAQDGLAQSHSALGQHQAALRVFRQVLAKNPRLGLVWLHRGQTHEKMGEIAAAEECYQKALANPGSNLSGLLELAAFCQSRGRSEPAAGLYLKAVELEPGNAEVRVGAAQHLAILGRREEAEHHAARAVALAPKFAEAHVLYGTLLGQRGERARAREQFELALQGNPELLDAKLNLGLTLISDEPAAALVLFEEVLQRNPAHPTAAKAAAECRKKIEGGRFNN